MQTGTLRIIAFCVDIAVIGFCMSPLAEIPLDEFNLGNQNFIAAFNFKVLGFPLYFFMFDLFCRRQTVGKYFTGISIIDEDGSTALSLKKLLIRTLVKWISVQIIPIAYIYYLFSNKALHDKFVKSKTINTAKQLD
jgi:uncharacterized RDD family membrane protein YckC